MANRNRESGGVGVEEADGVGGPLGGEAASLVDEFLGEIEGGEMAVADRPEAEGDPAGAAAGFEEGRGFIGKEAFDEQALGRPEAEFVCGARVVDDREEVVEVGANRRGGNFAGWGQWSGTTGVAGAPARGEGRASDRGRGCKSPFGAAGARRAPARTQALFFCTRRRDGGFSW